MIIRRLHASFGRLSGEELFLTPGLNILEQPNEAGKSTWCAFIRAMLYGIDTSDRDKAGYLSDKTRYLPWNGSPMEGSMDITADGKDITLQRTSLGKAPMRNFTAVYTGTGEPVQSLGPENAGLLLTGVPKAVFERTAFIRQSGMRVGQTPELERRIASLVSSGDESLSYTEADASLRAWLRKRRFNKSGTIPALQAKLSETEGKLALIEEACEESASLRIEADRLRKEKALLTEELRAHEILDIVIEKERLEDAKKASEAAAEEAEIALSRLSKFGNADNIIIAGLRSGLSAVSAYEEMLESEKAKLKRASEEADGALDNLKTSVFAGRAAAAATDAARGAENAEESLGKRKKSLSAAGTVSVVLFLCFAALAVAGFAGILPFDRTVSYVSAALAAVCAAAIAVILISAGKSGKKLARTLSEAGFGSVAEFKAEAERYSALCLEAESKGIALSAAEKAVMEAEKRLSDNILPILKKAGEIKPGISIGEIPPLLDEIEAKRAEYRKLEAKSAMLHSIYCALINAKKTGSTETVSAAGLINPRHDRNTTMTLLENVTRSLESVSSQYNITLGRMRALGDPLVLAGEKKECEEALKEQSLQYGAIETAIDALREASAEIQSRFSPILGRTAGIIFNRLTGGRYDMLSFDRALDASARAHGETVSRDVLSLSAGTADQVYLALRLATCEIVLSSADPCPVILDDALSNFDDKRMGLALDYLRELSGKRQIILFTCQGREYAYFSGNRGVNIVKT